MPAYLFFLIGFDMHTKKLYYGACILSLASGIAGYFVGMRSRGLEDGGEEHASKIENLRPSLQNSSLGTGPKSYAVKSFGDQNEEAKEARTSSAEKGRQLLAVRSLNLFPTRIPLRDKFGSLSKQLIRVFDLNETEALNATQAIAVALDEIEKHVAANTQIVSADDKAVVVTTVPFSAGPDIYAKFVSDLDNAIGAERANTLLALQADDIQRAFHSFGAESRKVQLSRVVTEGGSEFELTDQRSTIQENGEMMSVTMLPIRFGDAGMIPLEYSWLGDIAPQLKALVAQEAPAVKKRGLIFQFSPATK